MARWVLLTSIVSAVLMSTGGGARVRTGHPVLNNIGSLCRWQKSCIARQQQSMQSALAFVSSSRPPIWRVQLCNRNASRARNKVDWVGFDACIRNKRLKKPRR